MSQRIKYFTKVEKNSSGGVTNESFDATEGWVGGLESTTLVLTAVSDVQLETYRDFRIQDEIKFLTRHSTRFVTKSVSAFQPY